MVAAFRVEGSEEESVEKALQRQEQLTQSKAPLALSAQADKARPSSSTMQPSANDYADWETF